MACKRLLPGSVPDAPSAVHHTPACHPLKTARPAGTESLDFHCVHHNQRPGPRGSHPSLRPTLEGPREVLEENKRSRRGVISFSGSRSLPDTSLCPTAWVKVQGQPRAEEGGARLRTTRTWPAGIPEGGPQVAARGGGRGREGGGLGARRAVTAARRGGASRPLAGEPWREAAPRRLHQCPRPQQRPCPPPRGPPGRRPRAPRAFDARAPRARRPLARGRARESPSAALASPRVSNAPTTPASPNPRPRAQERQGGRRAVGGGGAGAEPPRVPPCRPAGCSGGNRSSRAAGVGQTTTRRKPLPRPLGTAPAAGLRSAPLLREDLGARKSAPRASCRPRRVAWIPRSGTPR
ncbi:translation initiation factor IF-2-like [Trachypithecus francoisi]|uniref:translation initiation factor IF-2-like n=1 Tax=Trachypithecus francoisi TaxID=54180 RepID=UPI00141BEF2B|nr:translation initiation factor IF-2-like [Trachypithecus francoisi]